MYMLGLAATDVVGGTIACMEAANIAKARGASVSLNSDAVNVVQQLLFLGLSVMFSAIEIIFCVYWDTIRHRAKVAVASVRQSLGGGKSAASATGSACKV